MLLNELQIRALIYEKLKEARQKSVRADLSRRGSKEYSDEELSPSGAEVTHSGPASDDKIDDVSVKRKSGANIKDLSKNTKSVIKYMYKKAKELGIDTPVITSGMRGPQSQASVMYSNWVKQGAKSGGKEYLIRLYANDKLAGSIGDVFNKNHPDKAKAVAGAVELLNKTPISNHARGDAFDLRVTSRIGELVSLLEKEKLIKPFDETREKSGPHWHIKVLKAAPEVTKNEK